MERILHFCVKPNPSEEMLEIIATARALHPSWQVKVWKDTDTEVGFLLERYYGRASSGVQRADLMRLDAVYTYGGIYLDADIRLVRNLEDLVAQDHFFCSENGRQLSNAIFGATKRSPVIKAIIDRLLEVEPDWTLPPNRTTGPHLFTNVLRHRPDLKLLPRETFFPYHFDEAPRPPLITTRGIHEWAGSWLSEDLRRRIHARRRRRLPRRITPWLRRLARRALRRVIDVVVPMLREAYPRNPSAYPLADALVVKTNRDLLMSLPGADLTVTPAIALTGTYQERYLRFVERTVRGGDFVVDLGAYVGVVTLVAARQVGPFGRVIVADANDEALTHLQRAVALNGFQERVRIIPAAGRPDEPIVALDRLFPYPVEIKVLRIESTALGTATFAGAERLLTDRSVAHLLLTLRSTDSVSVERANRHAVQRVLDMGYQVGVVDGFGVWRASPSIDEALRLSRDIVLCRI